VVPPIPGIDLDGVQICKTYEHAKRIEEANNDDRNKRVAIVGGGYIGVELVDAFNAHNKEVTLIDMAPRIMAAYYDKPFTDMMETRMKDAGVKMMLSATVQAFEGENGHVTRVVTDKGSVDVDYVVFSVGVKAQSQLVNGVVDLSPRGLIKTNAHMMTSNPDIYAIGDCAEVYDDATGQSQAIQLATTAVRTGIIAAMSILNQKVPTLGFTGANAIDVFGFRMAGTGVTVETAHKLNMDVDSIIFEDNDRPEFMNTVDKV